MAARRCLFSIGARAFYVIGAGLVLRRAYLESQRAIGTLVDKRDPDRNRSHFMVAAAVLYGAAGLALLLRSGHAFWLLGAGLLLQASYYGVLGLLISPEVRADDERWRKADCQNGQHGRLRVSAYAMRSGILS